MRSFCEINRVKVFKSLLVLSLLETILWSFCLLSSASGAASTDVAQAYYVRETVNLKSCVSAGYIFPRVSLPISAAAALAALREESRSQQLFYQAQQDKQAAVPHPTDRQQQVVVFPVIFGQDSGGSADEPAGSLVV